MNIEEKKELIRALEQLLEGKNRKNDVGICNNLSSVYDIFAQSYEKYFKTWKHYSGLSSFPVPSTTKNVSASGIYFSTANHWKQNKYGNLRKDLCRHIIRELKKEIRRKRKL